MRTPSFVTRAILCASIACAAGACKKKDEPASQAATTPKPLPALETPKPGKEIKFVSLPVASRPIVSLRVQFLSGSIDDPKGKEGLTSLTAEVMAEGGTQALSSAELQAVLFPMAAELSVHTGKETTTFIGRVHKDHLARFLPLFLDVLTKPRWDSKEFERLRSDAISDIEKRLRTSDDENLGKEALEWLLYEGHPYQSFVGGTVRGLRSLTIDDLKAHAQRVFTRARLTVGLAGGVDAALEQTVRDALVALPAGVGGRPPLPATRDPKTRVMIVEKDATATAISMGHTIQATRASPDHTALFVARSIFGEHRQMHGRLFQELREKRGLNYGNYAYIEHFVQDGWGTYPLPNVARRQQHFSIWIRPVEHANRLFALRAALFETERLLKEGVTAEELSRARGFLAGYTRMWEQTDSRRLGFALDDQFYASPPYLETLRKGFAALTTDSVSGAIRKHIDPARLRIVFVTPKAAELRDALLSGKPTPIRYPSPKDAKVLETDKRIEAFPLTFKADEIRIVRAHELFEAVP
jgi:zinc protease